MHTNNPHAGCVIVTYANIDAKRFSEMSREQLGSDEKCSDRATVPQGRWDAFGYVKRARRIWVQTGRTVAVDGCPATEIIHQMGNNINQNIKSRKPI